MNSVNSVSVKIGRVEDGSQTFLIASASQRAPSPSGYA